MEKEEGYLLADKRLGESWSPRHLLQWPRDGNIDSQGGVSLLYMSERLEKCYQEMYGNASLPPKKGDESERAGEPLRQGRTKRTLLLHLGQTEDGKG